MNKYNINSHGTADHYSIQYYCTDDVDKALEKYKEALKNFVLAAMPHTEWNGTDEGGLVEAIDEANRLIAKTLTQI